METEKLNQRGTDLMKTKNLKYFNILEPMRKPVDYMGFFFLEKVEGRLKKMSQILQTILLLFVLVLLLFFLLLLCLPLFGKKMKLDQGTVQRLCNILFSIEAIVSFCYLIYWRKMNCIRSVWMKLESATKNVGMEQFYCRFKFLKISSLLMVALVMISQLLYVVDTFFDIFNLQIKKLELDSISMNNIYVKFLGVIGIFYLSTSWGSATLLYGTLCWCFLSEYKTLNDNCKRELSVDKSVIDSYVSIYNKLRSVIEHANEIFSGYIFVMMFFNVCLIIFDLYDLLRFEHTFTEYLLVCLWLVTSSVQVWGLSWLPAMVNCEVWQYCILHKSV